MPHFNPYDFIKWLHLVALAMGGGAAMIILILAGLEDSRADLKGMTSLLWKRTAAWAFRLAVVLGLVLLFMRIHDGDQPFAAGYLHWKLTLVFLLLMCSEMSTKALARSRRGVAMLAFMFFLMATFVTVNRDAFGTRRVHGLSFTGAVEQGPNP